MTDSPGGSRGWPISHRATVRVGGFGLAAAIGGARSADDPFIAPPVRGGSVYSSPWPRRGDPREAMPVISADVRRNLHHAACIRPRH